MSDVPETTPDGAVEATQSEAAPQDRPVMPEGWTGEFDPHRAKATIDRLREFEAEAKQFRQIREDREARERWLAEEMGYELDSGEDEEPVFDEPFQDDDPVEDLRTRQEQIEAKLQEREVQETIGKIHEHIAELAKDSEFDLTDKAKDYIFAQAVKQEVSPEATQQAFKDFTEFLNEYGEKRVERYLESKRAPEPPPTGKAGERDGRTHEDRVAQMAARIQAGMSDG